MRNTGLSGLGIGLIGRAVAAHIEEQHSIAEWESTLRIWAGGRDGQRAIDWARKYYADVAPTLPYGYRLSDTLAAAYHRLMRGDIIAKDGTWRTR